MRETLIIRYGGSHCVTVTADTIKQSQHSPPQRYIITCTGNIQWSSKVLNSNFRVSVDKLGTAQSYSGKSLQVEYTPFDRLSGVPATLTLTIDK